MLGRRKHLLGSLAAEEQTRLELLVRAGPDRITFWVRRDTDWSSVEEPALVMLDPHDAILQWGGDCLGWRERGEQVVDLLTLGRPVSPDLLKEWLSFAFRHRALSFSLPAALVVGEPMSDWLAQLWSEVARELDWKLVGWLPEPDRLALMSSQARRPVLELDAEPRCLAWRYWSEETGAQAGHCPRLGWAGLLERAASYFRFHHLFEPCRERLRETLAHLERDDAPVVLLGRDLRSGLPRRLVLTGREALLSLPELQLLWGELAQAAESAMSGEEPHSDGGGRELAPPRMFSLGLFRPAGWQAFWRPLAAQWSVD